MTSPAKPIDPSECVLWRRENLAIEELRNIFEPLLSFAEDSHFVRKLLRCKECGHLYFYEFYEEIDWKEGKDGQYWTWIPVDDRDTARELSRLSLLDVLQFACIRYDVPSGTDEARGPAWYGRKSP
jgi:hypothetical protein